MLTLIGGYLFIFFARVIDVSLTTLRMLMLVKGHRFYAAGIGFFEVLIYLASLRIIFANLDTPLNLVFYAAGFATGNIVGSFIEEKLAVGVYTVQVITLRSPLELTEQLRACGYGVTAIEGRGREGARYILQIIVQRKCIPQLRREIDEWDKEAFWTVFEARSTRGGIFLKKGQYNNNQTKIDGNDKHE
ncbi:MAG: DUF2179 domain-containing protein [Clostridia bacterium]|jgi:uncharacterized protein YebE (UPF0316 family)|nr:DUF2179 domain-containing protein [Clostridia bacterium]